MPSPTPPLPRKTKKLSTRLTEVEWEYIESIAKDRRISMSEANRWLIHQSILLTTILVENPEIIKRAKKVLLEMPHIKVVEPT